MTTPDQPTPEPYGTPPPGYAAAPPPGYGQGYPPGYGQGYPPAYGQPAYPYGYGPVRRNGLGTAALVCGVIAIVMCWTVGLGIILGVLGIVFGIIGRQRATRGEATNGGAALAGLVTGAIGLALGIAFIAIWVHYVHDHCTRETDTGIYQCGSQYDND